MGSTKTCNSCTAEIQICNFSDIDEKNLYQNHYVIKGTGNWSTKNLSSKKIYSILISNIVNKSTPNIYFEKLFENHTLDWSKTYSVTRLTTIDSTFHSFQYKILDNVFFLNKKLYTFGIKTMSFANFAKNWRKLPYIYFMNAFMLNLFGKDNRENCRMKLSWHHLYHSKKHL